MIKNVKLLNVKCKRLVKELNLLGIFHFLSAPPPLRLKAPPPGKKAGWGHVLIHRLRIVTLKRVKLISYLHKVEDSRPIDG